MVRSKWHWGMLLSASTLAIVATQPVGARQVERRDYDLPAQDLGSALKAVALASGEQVLVSADLVSGKTAPALHGHFSADEAIVALLAGSDLKADFSGEMVTIRGRNASPATAAGDADPYKIVITGSRIQKGAVASPIVTLTRKEIREAGQNDLGDAVRSLPQAFGGGQNPGVAPGAVGINNQNITAGSSPNLRGLGADATLTLLNGHRLSYGSFVQAVDISAIPLAAVDHIDVVADGASAIYGSDAVGGVVNVILKPDYQGLSTSARIGGATDGGDFEQQYDATGGASWGSGGFIATYDFSRGTAIRSDQRDYTRAMPLGNTLYPSREGHSGLVSGHQQVGPDLTFSIDATYNHRTSASTLQVNPATKYVNLPAEVSLSVAPSAKLAVGPNWTFSLTGLYAFDHTRFDQLNFANFAVASRSAGCHCNDASLIEASGEGPVLRLPAGDLRLALGGGYRRNSYDDTSSTQAGFVPAHATLRSYYAFGEAFAPLVSPAQDVPWVRQLSLDAALRYERYPGMAQVATPKLGVVYAPSSDLDVKFSWGKSFKAPNLVQESQQLYAYLYPASFVGGAGLPAGSTAMIRFGGNPDLKPERATSWTVTLIAHPQPIPGLRFELSYFRVNYRNRIVQPFSGASLSRALTDPEFQPFVTPDPSVADQAASISAAGQGLTNLTGAPYDPSRVVALINDVYLNSVRQRIQGVDLSATYKVGLGALGSLNLRGMGSWLDSRQTLSSSGSSMALAGTIFNPPHYKGLVAASWAYRSFSLTSTVNIVGGLTDTTQTPHVRVGPQTTLDLVATLDIGRGGGVFRDLGLSLVVRNALNQRPPYARPSGGAVYYVDYDSTNYSAIGRFVGLTVTRSW